ncbi:hypothetical protein EPN16_00390 [bacterium]|nr:MAG: hypothetical protein EPN16_00390 [bacterium]
MRIAGMPKIELTKRTIVFILGGSAAFVLIAFFIYIPLLKEVKSNGLEWRGIRGQLESARLNLEILDKSGVSKRLIPGREASSAADVIVKQGRGLLLNFRSISQKEIRSENGHEILPLRMEIDGDYRQLGYFFGFLETMKDVIVTVEDFQIRRSDAVSPKVSAVVTLRIHLLKS